MDDVKKDNMFSVFIKCNFVLVISFILSIISFLIMFFEFFLIKIWGLCSVEPIICIINVGFNIVYVNLDDIVRGIFSIDILKYLPYNCFGVCASLFFNILSIIILLIGIKKNNRFFLICMGMIILNFVIMHFFCGFYSDNMVGSCWPFYG